MGKFEELSRQLGYTFTQLENAQGGAKRRWLRKAHLLLLLADEMAEDAEAGALSVRDGPTVANPRYNQNVPDAQSPLWALAEDAARSAERGSCRGLQTVLILRKRANQP
jgi:hypothetical protein